MSENTSVKPGVFIDGSWQDCDAARLVSHSPIDGSEVAAFSVAGTDAAGRAIDAAVAAQSEWADLSAHDRGGISVMRPVSSRIGRRN